MSEVFRIDVANIMHEVIEGEVVIVNLDNGSYYSLDAVGAAIWVRLASGCALDALIDDVAERYGATREDVAPGVRGFVRQLQLEKLIVAGNGADAPGHADVARAAPNHPYADPVLHKYTDMEELLLVDPIHEVEDSGWPNAR